MVSTDAAPCMKALFWFNAGISAQSFHVLPVPAWVAKTLQNCKNMCVKLIDGSKLSISVNVKV